MKTSSAVDSDLLNTNEQLQLRVSKLQALLRKAEKKLHRMGEIIRELTTKEQSN